MSDKVGTVDYSPDDSMKGYSTTKEFSEETARIIDEETKRIIEEALQRAKKILLDKKPDLEKLAQSLLEYETLSGDEIKDLLAGKEIRKASSKSSESKSAASFIPSVSGDAVA